MLSAWRNLDQPDRRFPEAARAALVDLLAVAVFVIIGRASHHESLSAAGLLSTAWPFFVGVGGGYVAVALTGWPVTQLHPGAVIALKTVIIGLVLRYGVQHGGTPWPFVVVTVLVLTALMLGWRLVARTRRWQRIPATSSTR